MLKNRCMFVVGCMAIAFASTTSAKPGDAGPHFGVNGVVSLHFSSPIRSVPGPVDVDRHNRVVFGVSTDDGDVIGALNADGSLDTSFGTAGSVWLDQYVVDVNVDSHNRIVVAETDESTSSLGIRVSRYLDSGDPDPTFGTSGSTLITYPFEDIIPNALALNADDEVFVVGTEPSEPTTGDSRILVIHFDNAGKLDPTFGVGGVRSLTLLPPGTEQSYGKSIALGAHGEVVVTGYTTLASHVVVVDIVKLTSTGGTDVTFGDGTGVIQTDAMPTLPSPRYSFSESVAVDAGGNVTTAGFAGTTADFRSTFYVARYQPNGKPDLGFNGGAPKLFNAAGFANGRAATVMIDGRGRIVVAGTTAKDIRSPSQSVVFRLNDDGSFDPTFGDHSGYQLLSEHVENGRAAFAHSGDIVVIGHAEDASALVVEERVGYDLPPIMPPDHF